MPKEELTSWIFDGGGRAHAVAKKHLEHPNIKRTFVAPGNEGIRYGREKEIELIDCDPEDLQAILAAVREHRPDIVEVTQDDAIAAGLVDLLRPEVEQVLGPDRASAIWEWSKVDARLKMLEAGIPQPEFEVFTNPEAAIRYARARYAEAPGLHLYTKADGLQRGKGSLRGRNLDETLENIERMRSEFGEKRFIIEEELEGVEFSYTVSSDGTRYISFGPSTDNKRVFDGDNGEQTGGMGGNIPTLLSRQTIDRIEKQIIEPLIEAGKAEGVPIKHFLYVNIMVTEHGPKVIEVNRRLGDPEAHMQLEALADGVDYLDLAMAAEAGTLNDTEITMDGLHRVCVVAASKGYPGNYDAVKGLEVRGLKKAIELPNLEFYSAGLALRDDRFYADGGRLFSLVGRGKTVVEAAEHAYGAMAMVSIEGNNLHYRTDIARRDIARFQARQ